jgi:hypothetical protein
MGFMACAGEVTYFPIITGPGARLAAMLLSIGMFFASAGAHAETSITQIDAKGGFAHLAISGEITQQDAATFDYLVKSLPTTLSVIDVDLNSPGGNVLAAIKIGRIIRSRWMWTAASDDPGAECASACVLVLAAGAVRIASDDSKVEIHRPYFQPSFFATLSPEAARQKYGQLADVVKAYLNEMGMSQALFSEMLKVPSDDGRILSSNEMQAFALTGWDPAYQEWTRAKHPN